MVVRKYEPQIVLLSYEPLSLPQKHHTRRTVLPGSVPSNIAANMVHKIYRTNCIIFYKYQYSRSLVFEQVLCLKKAPPQSSVGWLSARAGECTRRKWSAVRDRKRLAKERLRAPDASHKRK